MQKTNVYFAAVLSLFVLFNDAAILTTVASSASTPLPFGETAHSTVVQHNRNINHSSSIINNNNSSINNSYHTTSSSSSSSRSGISNNNSSISNNGYHNISGNSSISNGYNNISISNGYNSSSIISNHRNTTSNSISNGYSNNNSSGSNSIINGYNNNDNNNNNFIIASNSSIINNYRHNNSVNANVYIKPSGTESQQAPNVSVMLGRDTIVELYNVPTTEDRMTRELDPSKVVHEPHICYDISQLPLDPDDSTAFTIHTQMDTGLDMSVLKSFNRGSDQTNDNGQYNHDATVRGRTNADPVLATMSTPTASSLPLIYSVPRAWSFHEVPSISAVQQHYSLQEDTTNVPAYHVRHVLMMLRVLNQQVAPVRLLANDTDQQFHLEDRVVPVRVMLNITAHSPAVCEMCTREEKRLLDRYELRLQYVPRRCRALFSDYDCMYDRNPANLPHTLAHIQECLSVFLINLVSVGNVFNFPQMRLNVTQLANPCSVEVLNLRKQRSVNCIARRPPSAPDSSKRATAATTAADPSDSDNMFAGAPVLFSTSRLLRDYIVGAQRDTTNLSRATMSGVSFIAPTSLALLLSLFTAYYTLFSYS